MWITCRIWALASLIILPCTFGAAHAQCAGYQVDYLYGYDCGLLGYSGAGFSDINDSSNACGGIGYCEAGADMIIWNGQQILLEVPLSLEFNLQALSINQRNDIVGIQLLPSGQNRGFVYKNGKHHLLNPLPGHIWSEAYAISNDARVVGFSGGGSTLRAVMWEEFTPIALELPIGPNSYAMDISDNGKYICGWMGEAPQPTFGSSGYLWHNGKVTDLGLLPGDTAMDALGVNNIGQVCGIAFAPGGPIGIIRSAFFWSDGVLQDIGILPGYTQCRALDINDLGQIIGRSESHNGVGEPFVWHNGIMHALNDLIPPELDLTISIVSGINNVGQIVGYGYDDDANQVGVILTPIPSPIGDSDCDSDIDVDDLLKVINTWGAQSPNGSNALPPADFNHDTIVNVFDLLIVIDNWTF